MNDDALSSFVDAYRAEHSARSLDRQALRQRVIAAAGVRRVRRSERLRLVLSFAATFAGSVAFAASPPVREHVREAFSFVRPGARSDAGVRHAAKRGGGRALPVPAVPAPGEPSASGPVPQALPVASLPVEPGSVRAERPVVRRPAPEPPRSVTLPTATFEVEPPVVAASAASAAKPAAVGSIPSGDLALYRRAHELHFGGASRAHALAAWDAYLNAYPRGTFAPEARLNRAVCLAKLGRKAEAEGVLVDIERGRFGDDGRRQARKILGVLEDE